jgi:hypothetical protein
MPVVAAGAGWHPENGTVRIYLGDPDANAPVVSANPAADGTFSVTFGVPDDGPRSGEARFVACQRCPGSETIATSTSFSFAGSFAGSTFVQPTVSILPEQANAGDTASVSGAGWIAAQPVSVFIGQADVAADEPAVRATPDVNGLFAVTVVVPDIGEGDRRVVACQSCGVRGEMRADAALRIVPAGQAKPVLLLRPSTAAAGNTIEIAGAGWWPSLGEVSIFVGSAEVAETVEPEPGGTFVLNVEIPDLDGGPQTVEACQRCGAPERVDARRILTVEAPAGSSTTPTWTAFAAMILLLLLVAAAWVFARARVRRSAEQQRPGPGAIGARGRLGAAEVELVHVEDGTSDLIVRLVPHRGEEVHLAKEMSDR